ncbi:Ig-like domain-containing protein [Enterovibrio sp. Hal110]
MKQEVKDKKDKIRLIISALCITLFVLLVSGCNGDKTSVAQQAADVEAIDDANEEAPFLEDLTIEYNTKIKGDTKTGLVSGFSNNFTATGYFSDGSTEDLTNSQYINWTSSDLNVAFISSNGIVKGYNPGNTVITATYKDPRLDGYNLIDATYDLEVLEKQVISVNVENQNAIAGVNKPFDMDISFSDGSRIQTSSALIDKGHLKIAKNQSEVDGAPTVSLDENNNLDLTNINQAANVLVLAFYGEQIPSGETPNDSLCEEKCVSFAFMLEVSEATLQTVNLSVNKPSIPAGIETLVTVKGTYSNGTTDDIDIDLEHIKAEYQDVTDVTDVTDLIIKKDGSGNVLFSSKKPGNIILTYENGAISQKISVKVTDAVVQAIKLAWVDQNEQTTDSYIVGLSKKIQATAKFSDESSSIVTSQVFWNTSDNIEVVRTNSKDLDQRYIKFKDYGPASVKVGWKEIESDEFIFDISDAEIEALVIDIDKVKLSQGSSTKFSVTATYNNKKKSDVTSLVGWRDQEQDWNKIINIEDGYIYALKKGKGEVEISAVLNNFESESIKLEVADKELTKIFFKNSDIRIPSGIAIKIPVTGIYTDDSVGDVDDVRFYVWKDNESNISVFHHDGVEVVVKGEGEFSLLAKLKSNQHVATERIMVSVDQASNLLLFVDETPMLRGERRKIEILVGFQNSNSMHKAYISKRLIHVTGCTDGDCIVFDERTQELIAKKVGEFKITYCYEERDSLCSSKTIKVEENGALLPHDRTSKY